MKIYISSTYEDLKDHRENVYRVLRAMRHDVIAMEDYVATDRRPLKKCLVDVASCDLYVGLFAWRYGHVPKKSNPKRKSVTELEYLAADKVERLIFLVKDTYPWLPQSMDAITGDNDAGKRIESLRAYLQEESTVGMFTTPDDLGKIVSIAVSMAGSQASIGHLSLPRDIADVRTIRKFGSTLTPEVADKIMLAMEDASGARIIEVDLGDGSTWWSTQLFLLAALAEEFTDVEQLMFINASGSFLGMATPAAVRRGLGQKAPHLESAFWASLQAHEARHEQMAVLDIAQSFRERWAAAEVDRLGQLPRWVKWPWLKRLLGDKLAAGSIRVRKRESSDMNLLFSRILQHEHPLVPVVEAGRPVRIMDRTELTRDLISSALL